MQLVTYSMLIFIHIFWINLIIRHRIHIRQPITFLNSGHSPINSANTFSDINTFEIVWLFIILRLLLIADWINSKWSKAKCPSETPSRRKWSPGCRAYSAATKLKRTSRSTTGSWLQRRSSGPKWLPRNCPCSLASELWSKLRRPQSTEGLSTDGRSRSRPERPLRS